MRAACEGGSTRPLPTAAPRRAKASGEEAGGREDEATEDPSRLAAASRAAWRVASSSEASCSASAAASGTYLPAYDSPASTRGLPASWGRFWKKFWSPDTRSTAAAADVGGSRREPASEKPTPRGYSTNSIAASRVQLSGLRCSEPSPPSWTT